jgi:hypothetical protein
MGREAERRRRPGTRLLWAASAVAAALLIAACGSSSSSTTATTGSAVATGAAHTDAVTNGVVVHRPAPGTGGAAVNDDNPGQADSGKRGPSASDPCTLVSKAEAQAIVGGSIATPQEAPLGPTCIYQPEGAKTQVTLTVESLDFAQIRAQLHDRRRVRIGGRIAYCGDYGLPTTFVPLSGGRVLSITAPCAVGTRFAAKALPRLRT